MTEKRALLFAIAGLAVLLQSGRASDRDVLPSLSSGQVQAIIDRASGERALDDIRRLSLIHRWFVSPGYDEAEPLARAYFIHRPNHSRLRSIMSRMNFGSMTTWPCRG